MFYREAAWKHATEMFSLYYTYYHLRLKISTFLALFYDQVDADVPAMNLDSGFSQQYIFMKRMLPRYSFIIRTCKPEILHQFLTIL